MRKWDGRPGFFFLPHFDAWSWSASIGVRFHCGFRIFRVKMKEGVMGGSLRHRMLELGPGSLLVGQSLLFC